MHTKKAFFFDWDGTLSPDGEHISHQNVSALRELQRNGHMILLCTGRSLAVLPPSVTDCNFDGMILGCGAHIILQGQVINRRTMPAQSLHTIANWCDQRGQWCLLEGEKAVLGVHDTRFTPLPDVVMLLPGGYYGQEPITKVTTGPIDHALAEALQGHVHAITHYGRYTEIVPFGCCKSDGLRRVLEALDMAQADSVAFGDSPNDHEMLAYAGYSVLMEGSPHEELRAVADYIAPRADGAGVAVALKALGLIE